MSWVDSLEQQVRAKVKTSTRYDNPAALANGLDSKYQLRPHLEYLSGRLAQAVADVEQGQDRYLTVSMPPRMGKSVLSSIYLPTWILQSHPTWKIGLISHSPTLASSWGRQVRRTVEHNPGLGIDLASDAGAVTDWQTTEGGGVISRSVGQATAGLGFKVLLLDDVVRDFVAAHSETNRDSVWDWWLANSRTRLEPPSLVVAVGTRWHEDDILGRLLSKEHEGDPAQWEQIVFPAIAQGNDVLGRSPGDPLISPLIDESPDKALARWADIKQGVGSYAWAALYQQNPAPSKGSIFDVGWWQYWDPEDLPETFDREFTSWDCAFKDTKTSDYVVGQHWGIKGPYRYLLDQVRGRWAFTETLAQMRQFNKGIYEHLVEDKANGTAVIDTLKREISGLIPINPTNSKEARARAITPDIESKHVLIPRPKPGSWVVDFLDECRSFPSGAHDDQVDAMTQALSRVRSAGINATVSGVARRTQLGGW